MSGSGEDFLDVVFRDEETTDHDYDLLASSVFPSDGLRHPSGHVQVYAAPVAHGVSSALMLLMILLWWSPTATVPLAVFAGVMLGILVGLTQAKFGFDFAAGVSISALGVATFQHQPLLLPVVVGVVVFLFLKWASTS